MHESKALTQINQIAEHHVAMFEYTGSINQSECILAVFDELTMCTTVRVEKKTSQTQISNSGLLVVLRTCIEVCCCHCC